MGCVAESSRSSDSASNSHLEPGTPSRRRSSSTPPLIQDWADALQSPQSSLSSKTRSEDWAEQRAAYHRGESPASRRCREPQRRRQRYQRRPQRQPGLQGPSDKKEPANAPDVQGCGSLCPELRHNGPQQQRRRHQRPPQDTGHATLSLAVVQEV